MRADRPYVGKAGQFTVMAELAWRGYNVSIPEIDIGDDVFVLNDTTGRLSRVQVKTASGIRLRRGFTDKQRVYRCQFRIRLSHATGDSGTHYVLAGRCGGSWRFLVFKRYILARLIHDGLGSPNGHDYRMITVIFYSRTEARTSTLATARDLSAHAHRWTLWKKLPGGASSN